MYLPISHKNNGSLFVVPFKNVCIADNEDRLFLQLTVDYYLFFKVDLTITKPFPLLANPSGKLEGSLLSCS